MLLTSNRTTNRQRLQFNASNRMAFMPNLLYKNNAKPKCQTCLNDFPGEKMMEITNIRLSVMCYFH